MSEFKFSPYTDFLYARPSFLEGLGRIMDFGNSLEEYNSSPSEIDADMTAIAADWFAIGDDLRKVLDDYATEIESAS